MSKGIIFFVKGPDRRYKMANSGMADVCNVEDQTDLIGFRSDDYSAAEYWGWCETLDQRVLDGHIYIDQFDCLRDARSQKLLTF